MQTGKCQSGIGEWNEDDKLGMVLLLLSLSLLSSSLLLLLLQYVCGRRKQYECMYKK